MNQEKDKAVLIRDTLHNRNTCETCLLTQSSCSVRCFHKKRVSEDVRHNLKMKQIFAIVKTWKWSKNAGNMNCWYVPRQCWRTRHTAVQILHNIATCHGCSIVFAVIFSTFLHHSGALVDSSIFWIFVVIMLLKTPLIVAKQLVYFLSQKI